MSVKTYKRIILFSLCAMVLLLAISNAALVAENQNARRGRHLLENKITDLMQDYEDRQDAFYRLMDETDHLKNLIYNSPGYSDDKSGIELSLEYQSLYEDMFFDPVEPFAQDCEEKVVYLTFDDGPSLQTERVLDILLEKDVKATFFVVGNTTQFGIAMYNRIVDEGHSIGVHTFSHDYVDIYRDVESFLDDFYKMFNLIYETTGVRTRIFRFPGGSVNAYNVTNYMPIISEMCRRGFIYHDWNVDGGDAQITLPYTKTGVYNRVVSGARRNEVSIVLLHDSRSKGITVDALVDIIDTLHREGYRFAPLDESVRPFRFSYVD